MARLLILLLTLAALASQANAQAPAAGRPVLLDFSIPGCLPCRQMEPVVARLRQDGFDVRKVDGASDPQTAARFRVQGYPTLVLLIAGQERWRNVGPVGYEQLRSLMTRATPQRPAAPPARVVPATYDSPSPAKGVGGAAFQVGGDLGPARVEGPTPQRLLGASVRLRVEDPQGHAFGTGTIIDARQGEALVLTCGHLFRDASEQQSVTVELFEAQGGAARVVDRAPGQVIAVDNENDVALVTLKLNRPVTPARVAASLAAVAAGEPVWSVGSDLGADLTIRTSRVVGVNRTHRPPNVSSTGAPVQGRSGGGLFNAAGELVGVCFGADQQRDEGLYADLVSIHAQLDRLGLTEIYRGAAAPGGAIATAEPLVPVAPPLVRAQDSPLPGGAAAPLPGLDQRERAALQELGAKASEAEVICIVRPKSPTGRSEVIALDSASPAFVEALRGMGSPPR